MRRLLRTLAALVATSLPLETNANTPNQFRDELVECYNNLDQRKKQELLFLADRATLHQVIIDYTSEGLAKDSEELEQLLNRQFRVGSVKSGSPNVSVSNKPSTGIPMYLADNSVPKHDNAPPAMYWIKGRNEDGKIIDKRKLRDHCPKLQSLYIKPRDLFLNGVQMLVLYDSENIPEDEVLNCPRGKVVQKVSIDKEAFNNANSSSYATLLNFIRDHKFPVVSFLDNLPTFCPEASETLHGINESGYFWKASIGYRETAD